MMQNKLLVGVCSLVCWGSVAAGDDGMVLLGDSRNVTMDIDTVWFDDNGNLNDLLSQQNYVPPEDFLPWSFDDSNGNDHVSLSANQNSFANATELAASGEATGVSSPQDGIDYLSRSGNNHNTFTIRFSISELTQFNIYADLFSSSGVSTSVVELIGTDGTNYNFGASASNGQELVDAVVALEAGTYRFTLRSSMSFGGAEDIHTASFDGGLRVVPSPSGLLVLVGGGLVGMRRRR